MDFKILSNDVKPNEGYMSKGIRLTNADLLHREGYLGEGMRVGVIDSGYDTHDFTKENIIFS